jgi:Ala-tRNA(Pro) deacylase
MDCKLHLRNYLNENGIGFHEMTHDPAFTAQEIAAALHVHGKSLAKVVMVKANDWLVMLVLPATRQIDFTCLKRALDTEEVRLAHENEFEHLFPDCDTGAMPPFGNLYGVPVCVDESLAREPEIVFQAGTHRETMQLGYKDFARLVKPIVADFTMLPAHARLPEYA